jgi:hypothetical protein
VELDLPFDVFHCLNRTNEHIDNFLAVSVYQLRGNRRYKEDKGIYRMNSGQSSSSQGSLPHLSHAEPWAHNFICCDTEHQASTSRGSTPMTRFSSRQPSLSRPSTSTAHSFENNAACCDETHCPSGDVVECCEDPSCSQGAVCEDEGCHDSHTTEDFVDGTVSAESMRELEKWACSKEGCHAIQQYVSMFPTWL